jgi:hypothetical protein
MGLTVIIMIIVVIVLPENYNKIMVILITK